MNKLPIEFKKYFWDCDFNKLDIVKYKEYVINRLLSFGDLQAIHYIFSNFYRKEILQYLNSKGNNTLNRTNYLFWQKLVKYDELWQK